MGEAILFNTNKIKPKVGKQFLYDSGNEFTLITGGWDWVKWRGSLSSFTHTKRASTLYANGVSATAQRTAYFGWSTKNKIDLTNYDKFVLVAKGLHQYNNSGAVAIVTDNFYQENYSTDSTTSIVELAKTTGEATLDRYSTIEVDISSITGSHYLMGIIGAIVSEYEGTIEISQAWIE